MKKFFKVLAIIIAVSFILLVAVSAIHHNFVIPEAERVALEAQWAEERKADEERNRLKHEAEAAERAAEKAELEAYHQQAEIKEQAAKHLEYCMMRQTDINTFKNFIKDEYKERSSNSAQNVKNYKDTIAVIKREMKEINCY